jgi:hypothetical protein
MHETYDGDILKLVDGSRGRREADIPEFANIQVEVIVPPEVAQTLLTRLERNSSRATG